MNAGKYTCVEGEGGLLQVSAVSLEICKKEPSVLKYGHEKAAIHHFSQFNHFSDFYLFVSTLMPRQAISTIS